MRVFIGTIAQCARTRRHRPHRRGKTKSFKDKSFKNRELLNMLTIVRIDFNARFVIPFFIQTLQILDCIFCKYFHLRLLLAPFFIAHHQVHSNFIIQKRIILISLQRKLCQKCAVVNVLRSRKPKHYY